MNLRSFVAFPLLGILLSLQLLRGEQVVIREIMYHPQMVPEGETPLPEFIEIENLTSSVFDIAGWKITGMVKKLQIMSKRGKEENVKLTPKQKEFVKFLEKASNQSRGKKTKN